MKTFLVLVLIAVMVMVLVSLVRGIVAFLKSSREEIDGAAPGGPTDMQKLQNRMMFARIKYQALAVVVVGALVLASR